MTTTNDEAFDEWWDSQEWLSSWADSRGVARAAWQAAKEEGKSEPVAWRDVFDRQALHIAALNHEAENQANRIQELEDKLAAAHKAMAAGEALARAVMLDQTGEG